jgi:hypothetical protein
MEPMGGRWVCRRCFASNDPDAATCVQCGLERGADPATAEAQDPQQAQPWAAPASAQPSPRPMWMQLALRFWWIGLIVVFAIGGWYFSARRDEGGQIANPGNLEVKDLRAGDCFNLKDPDAAEVDEVEAKPCSDTHQYELYHAADMASGDYPSDDAVDAFLQAECAPAFGSYVGLDYQTSVLGVIYFTPSSDGWDDGDHSVQCAVYDPANEELTSSLKSSAR